MLDRTQQRHVLTSNGTQGFGYRCSCSCGESFYRKSDATEHYYKAFYCRPAVKPTQDVDMFPRVEFYWDRYTDRLHPINPAAFDMKRDWSCD